MHSACGSGAAGKYTGPFDFAQGRLFGLQKTQASG